MFEKRKYLFITIFIIFILLANTFVVWPLFGGEYETNTASIGIAHIINANFFKRFGWYVWNPFWYAGFPAHLTYPILAPVLYSLPSLLLKISVASSYRLLNALAYVVLPISVFFLTRKISKSLLAATFASLIFAFVPSINYFLIPTFLSIGKGINFIPWQLSVLLDYGEGPHTMSLALIPFAVIAYLSLLKSPTNKKLVATAIITGLVILINLFSAYSLIFFYLVAFFSEVALGKFTEKLKISLLLGILIYGFIAFAYDLSMINALANTGYIHPENRFHLPELTKLVLLSFVAAPILFGIFEIVKSKKNLQGKVLLGGWFLIYFAIPFIYYKFNYWLGSQPNRYLPELNIVSAAILGWIIASLIDKIAKILPQKFYLAIATTLSMIVLFSIYMLSKDYLLAARDFVRDERNYQKWPEYKISRWLGDNLEKEKGERAYLTGSPAFFANAFADILQIRGDADNGQPNPWWADVSYQLNKGKNSLLAINWLKTYGVRYLVVEGSNVSTPYRDFAYPQKFSSLTKKAEINGFNIYEIPDNTELFIRLESAGALENIKIENVLDEQSLNHFLEVISNDKSIDFNYQWWENPSKALVKVENANKDDVILFRQNFDQGWQAQVEGKKAKIDKVGPNFMLIKPEKSGSYEVSLTWNVPKSIYLGWAITFITIVFSVYLLSNEKSFFKKD